MNVGVEIILVTRCSRKVWARNGTGAVANIGQQWWTSNCVAHMFLLSFVHPRVSTEELLYSNLITDFMKLG